jgi:pimeloyl-ACP methyl ester carboxylesterase
MSEVVLIHGAWHGPWCWERVVDELTARQVAVTAVELPFTGFADDVAAARRAVEAAGEGAVVCGHSYGGIVMDKAVEGLAGVGHVVYLAAFMNTGTDVIGDAPAPLNNAIIPDGETCTVDPAECHALFYADSDAATAAAAIARLRPMILDVGSFFDNPPPRPSAKTTYIICNQDRAVPVPAQRTLAALCADTVEWPTDHSAFLTRPGDVADILAARL